MKLDKESVVILANGEFPFHSIPLMKLKQATFIICCDGAANQLVEYGIEPSLIIGDLDSVTPAIKTRFKNRLVHIKDQYTNDLTKAILWCIEHEINQIDILGAGGKREDHTIGNIGLLSEYARKLEVKLYTNTGFFISMQKSGIITSFKGQQISIFSQTKNQINLISKGLKYPLENIPLDYWYMGTLNESEGDQFSLEFTEGEFLVFCLYGN